MVIKYNKVRARETRLIPRSQGFGWVGFFVGMREGAGEKVVGCPEKGTGCREKGCKSDRKGGFFDDIMAEGGM